MNLDDSHAVTGRTATLSPFKQAQAYHKRNGNDPNRLDDLDRVLDVSRKADHEKYGIFPMHVSEDTAASACEETGASYYHGPVFGIANFPGVLFAPHALSRDLQLELAYESVAEYCESPHRTNIDLCPPKTNETINRTEVGFGERMWSLWKQQQQRHLDEEDHYDRSRPTGMTSSSKKAKIRHPTSTDTIRYYKSFQKLSWATMGYHYDWTERSYNRDHKSPMPQLVASLATIFGRTCLRLLKNTRQGGQQPNQADHSRTLDSFLPTASIVNYYTTKSTMGGHRDDLELALDKPIVSISLGLPAIFILGGPSKEQEPVLAILLRPGDALCMGGESRLNFHAMARVLPFECTAAMICGVAGQDSIDTSRAITLEQLRGAEYDGVSRIAGADGRLLSAFLRQHRININVRQVYPDETEGGNT
jgi:alkylated DNA repair protein alkB family protein 1